ncbi:hypothetical protein ACRS9C_11410 [Serratia marcescens]|uniref:hypothetical protein n=1 Tax=Serratia marcescens TaxID=615 RepID=UPI003EDF2181
MDSSPEPRKTVYLHRNYGVIIARLLRVFHLVIPLFSQNFSLNIFTVFIAGMPVLSGFLYPAIVAMAQD